MKKKCMIFLCVVFMLSAAAGCGSKSMDAKPEFASGESSMNGAFLDEDYGNEQEMETDEGITSGGLRTEIDPHRLSVFTDDRI